MGTCIGPNKYGTPSLTSNTLLSIHKDGKYLSSCYYRIKTDIGAFKLSKQVKIGHKWSVKRWAFSIIHLDLLRNHHSLDLKDIYYIYHSPLNLLFLVSSSFVPSSFFLVFHSTHSSCLPYVTQSCSGHMGMAPEDLKCG